jgi:hypothetical protein
MVGRERKDRQDRMEERVIKMIMGGVQEFKWMDHGA